MPAVALDMLLHVKAVDPSESLDPAGKERR